MKQHGHESTGTAFDMQFVLQLIRAGGAILGVFAIVLGLVYVTRMFGAIFGALQAPESFNAHLDKWALALGGERLDITFAGTTFNGATIAALMVLGGGAVVLAWLSIGLVLAGAKIVSWTLGDREAIKKMLASALAQVKKDDAVDG